jgi:hypothetical protein
MNILVTLNEDGTVAAYGNEIPHMPGHFITNELHSPIWVGEALGLPEGDPKDYRWNGSGWVLRNKADIVADLVEQAG